MASARKRDMYEKLFSTSGPFQTKSCSYENKSDIENLVCNSSGTNTYEKTTLVRSTTKTFLCATKRYELSRKYASTARLCYRRPYSVVCLLDHRGIEIFAVDVCYKGWYCHRFRQENKG